MPSVQRSAFIVRLKAARLHEERGSRTAFVMPRVSGFSRRRSTPTGGNLFKSLLVPGRGDGVAGLPADDDAARELHLARRVEIDRHDIADAQLLQLDALAAQRDVRVGRVRGDDVLDARAGDDGDVPVVDLDDLRVNLPHVRVR